MPLEKYIKLIHFIHSVLKLKQRKQNLLIVPLKTTKNFRFSTIMYPFRIGPRTHPCLHSFGHHIAPKSLSSI